MVAQTTEVYVESESPEQAASLAETLASCTAVSWTTVSDDYTFELLETEEL